jgi:hypothetical protein
MWRGRCGVAEYAFDEAASLPRWTLPESTDVLVTDQRVLYAYTADDGHQVKSGELRWLWPQHLRVQPGARSRDRGAAATQIQLVCGGADGTYPALVFAGGDLATVADADRVANVIRQAIARFRVDHADKIGLNISQTRMLSRLLIGPEFRNHQGGEGQTVSLLGALLVNRPAPAPALPSAGLPSAGLPSAGLPSAGLPSAGLPSAGSPPAPADPVLDPVVSPAAPVTSAPADYPAPMSAAPAVSPPAAYPAPISAAPVASPPADYPTSAAPAASPPAAYPAPMSAAPVASPAADYPASLPASAPAGAPPAPSPGESGTRLINYRPGRAADAARALMAAKAEEAAHAAEPATAFRAADLAARVANLVTQFAELADDSEPADPAGYSVPRHAEPTGEPDLFDVPTTNLAERAEAVRRTAARMAANSASFRAGSRRADREPGISTRGNRTT